jgi:hypothetical protein
MAGFDLRARCPEGLRCAGYLQAIGEDQVRHFPSKYLGVYGLEWWTADGAHRFIAEYAETGCKMPIGQGAMKNCAYRNYAYPQGYVNGGRWLGASAGPDSRLLTLGWIDAARSSSLRLRAGRIGSRAGTFSAGADDPEYAGRAFGLAARRSFAWSGFTVTPQLDWLRVRASAGTRHEVRAGVELRWGPDGAR